METEQESQLTAEAGAFIHDMLNYILPRRFKQNIPRIFGTGEGQLTESHFKSDIGEAILLTCYIHRNSFQNRFLLEYPENLADAHTFAAYYKRYALELYDEENVINSLLMVSAILIEMVSYCSMPTVKNGTIFVNSIDTCWSSIFVNQFARTFFAAGGWFTLQKISREKTQIYDQIKREYSSCSNEDIPFHYWIDYEDPETPITSVLEAGYCSIGNRMHQMIQANLQLKSIIQQIIDINDEFELKSESLQQNIGVLDCDQSSIAQASESLNKLSLQESKDLKSDVSIIYDVSDPVSTNMDMKESNMERKTYLERKSTDLGVIAKTVPTTDAIYDKERNMEIASSLELMNKFKDITYDANMTHGIYFDRLFKSSENNRLLMNDIKFLRMMKHTVNNPEKPDTKSLIIAARNIIKDKSSATTLNCPLLENQAMSTSIGSGDVFENAFDALNLQETPEKDILPLDGKVKVTAKAQSQQEKFPARHHRPEIDKNVSTGKMHRLKSTVLSTITTAYLKTSIETALRTLKNKQCTVSQINEHRKSLYAVIDKKYIRKVFQNLNFDLDATFSEIDELELDDLTFPYTGHGADIMIELVNFADTFNRIQDLEFVPNVSLRRYLKKNFKQLISGRAEIRSLISTLEHLRLTPLDDLKVSQYYRELIRILICECAYFLQLQEKLQELKETLESDCPSRLRKNLNESSSQSSAIGEVSLKYPNEVDNRKRRNSSSEEQADCSPTKHAMVNISEVERVPPKFSSEADNRKKRKSTSEEPVDCSPSKQAMVNTSEYSKDSANNSACSPPKCLMLPTDDDVKSVQIADSNSREENVENSSDSDENKN